MDNNSDFYGAPVVPSTKALFMNGEQRRPTGQFRVPGDHRQRGKKCRKRKVRIKHWNLNGACHATTQLS